MPVTVYIATALRELADHQARMSAEAPNVAGLLDDLVKRYPSLRDQVLDDEGRVHRHLNIYVNSEEICSLQGVKTSLHDGDEVAVVPAVAGGALPFTEEQIRRYSRHIILPEVGGKGQRKLLNAKVLLIGAGGLGSPAALYLAAAGVGHLGIVDFDDVDLSNLQRQVIHHVHDLGRPKVVSATETIKDINPDVNVVQYPTRVSSENIMELITGYDVIVDGCDNFPTRYLVNDACVLAGKPNVHGSIFRFDGQATVFYPGRGCYRCLFPAPPPPGMVPSCQEAGVLGVLPGIIGVIQATETVKLILGAGEPLIGRLLLYDALTMEFREVKIRRDANCPICGDSPTIKELIDYEQFCGIVPAAHS
ncbi:MAG: molybdopterin-synthase adenylyltransferase MoeB [Chloroflexi bacterium]|nr:molybdopterin-synthase adenylyltransferase MoeB [Chloroflexota bacterium]